MTLTALFLAAQITVLDGDTFILDGETVRIANIDAPETREARCDSELRLGHVATARLAALLAAGAVTLKRGDPFDGRKTDRHGRTLALVMVDGRDIGLVLVGEELARPWDGKRHPWCQ